MIGLLRVRPAALAGPETSNDWMFCAWPGALRDSTLTDVALAAKIYIKLEASPVSTRVQ
jgi:hypothetical protein